MSDPVRVFIVDDHPLVREWLGNLLRLQPDFEICGEAATSKDAMRGIADHTPDVAIVDLSLDRESGLDLIKEMQRQFPDVNVLVLSMHEEITQIERALRAGARGYVMKREATSQIVAAIRQVRDGRLYADPTVLAALAERAVGRKSGASAEALETLSDREIDVFRRIGDGHSTRTIADDLGISLKTVQTYYARMREKLGLADASELTHAAVRWRAQTQP